MYPKLREFATVFPGPWGAAGDGSALFSAGMSEENPGVGRNLVAGKWTEAKGEFENDPDMFVEIVDPLTGEVIFKMPNTIYIEGVGDFAGILHGLEWTPKSGLHNPLKNPERYAMLSRVCFKAAMALSDPEIADYFARLVQRFMPKSYAQCMGEVTIVREFLKNLAGDGCRHLARGFSQPGDHQGQESRGYRWPFGGVGIIAPFNFPLEIPALQLVGALVCGNRPFIKGASTTSCVIEQFVRLLIACGLPAHDLDLVHCTGYMMSNFLEDAASSIRLLQFTGSSETAEELSRIMGGRIRIEDAGFDWKILGPDCDDYWLHRVARQCDQDAFAASGQKCSAQSILFAHQNWINRGLRGWWKEIAAKRNLADLTVGPVLTWTTKELLGHVRALLEIPGAELWFGGRDLTGHTIPEQYGAIEPTCVFVPFCSLLGSEAFALATTEVFGPVTVVTDWVDDNLKTVIDLCDRMNNHLTAAVVSGNQQFLNKVLGSTVNGTTYAGLLARTTGAPQNHWFGPAGDPRAAGIGSFESTVQTWTSHREIIWDVGPGAKDWKPVQS